MTMLGTLAVMNVPCCVDVVMIALMTVGEAMMVYKWQGNTWCLLQGMCGPDSGAHDALALGSSKLAVARWQ